MAVSGRVFVGRVVFERFEEFGDGRPLVAAAVHGREERERRTLDAPRLQHPLQLPRRFGALGGVSLKKMTLVYFSKFFFQIKFSVISEIGKTMKSSSEVDLC